MPFRNHRAKPVTTPRVLYAINSPASSQFRPLVYRVVAGESGCKVPIRPIWCMSALMSESASSHIEKQACISSQVMKNTLVTKAMVCIDLDDCRFSSQFAQTLPCLLVIRCSAYQAISNWCRAWQVVHCKFITHLAIAASLSISLQTAANVEQCSSQADCPSRAWSAGVPRTMCSSF